MNSLMKKRSLSREDKVVLVVGMAIITVIALLAIMHPAFAADWTATLKTLYGKYADIIGSLCQFVGVMLVLWGTVQLILAIKNEDADSKSRATMLCGVGAVLVCMPAIITTLDLAALLG